MQLKPLDLTWALDSELPPLDFVLPGLTPGSVGLIVAPGATGKSTLALDIAASMALGRPCAGGLFNLTSPATVLYLAAEESPQLLAERLRRLLNVFERKSLHLRKNLKVLPMAGENSLLVSAGQPTALFNDLVKECAGARLVIVDPLRRLHNGDENDSSHMTALVVALEALAKTTGAAVLALHHANRSSQLDAKSQNAARGSTALVDAARWQINLSRIEAKASDAEGTGSLVAVDFAKMNYIAPVGRQVLQFGADGRLSLSKPSTRKAHEPVLGGARNL